MTQFMWGRPEGFDEETGINYRIILKKILKMLSKDITTTDSVEFLLEEGFTEEEADELIKMEKEIYAA